MLEVKIGDKVKKGDMLAFVHANNEDKLEEAKRNLMEIIKIGENVVDKEKTILESLY